MYRDIELQMDSHLVLFIKKDDNDLFIIWDKETQMFHIRGKRQNIEDEDNDYVPYALKYNIWDNLYSFVNFTFGTNDTTSVVLYNFNNIKRLKLAELSYEYLETLIDKNYEISRYDRIPLRTKSFMRYLDMLME